MNKFTDEQRHRDCTCCGYESCHEMAVAIHNGFNVKDNCIYYIKDMVSKEKEEITRLMGDIEKQKQSVHRIAENINSEFEVLNSSLQQMEAGNNANASESMSFPKR